MSGKEYKKEGFISFINAQTYYNAIGKLAQLAPLSKDNGSLFHYTSTKVLNSILSTGTFRASNLFYLNDKIEYKMGITTLKNVFRDDTMISGYLDEIECFDGKSFGGVYSISYSSEPDVLQQWITYAKEAGVCIELDGDIIWNEEADDLYLGLRSSLNTDIRLKNQCFLKLAYKASMDSSSNLLPQLKKDNIRLYFAEAIREATGSEKSETKAIDEYEINEIWKDNKEEAKYFLQLLAAYYKEERFQGEEEIRAAFLPVVKSQKAKTQIFYFEQDNGVLRPYVDVRFLHKRENNFFVECPIKSILIGPGGNQTSVFDSIIHRLKHGEIKTWKYSDCELGNLLSQYILGCFQQMKIGQTKDFLAIANILSRQWCTEIQYSYCIKKATKTEVEVIVNATGSLPEKKEDSEEAQRIAHQYMRDNYLSPQGIWVKKSSLSYIF